MSDYCSSSSCSTKTKPNKYRCPACLQQNVIVSTDTIYHHIISPWQWKKIDQNYYFCNTPECDVIYYGQDDSMIKKPELRTQVGVKEDSDNVLICYCFGVTKKEAINNHQARPFVTQQTKEKACACTTHNPSGRCCLKDFPKTRQKSNARNKSMI